MAENIHPYKYKITSKYKWDMFGQKSLVLWFTGLSGSGKSTIANLIQYELVKRKVQVQVLDGDNVRSGLNVDLGFSKKDRTENIRRVSEVAKLFADSGVLTICSFISPTIEIRKMAKKLIGKEYFVEVFIDTPLEVCEKRDPKGLYKKARAGEIKNFTGISAPYEPPKKPDLVIKPAEESIESCVSRVIDYIFEHEYVYKVPSKDSSWIGRNYGNREVLKSKDKYAVFIGRYQPYHKGHISLIRQKLDMGVPVVIMVRDIEPNERNPFTTEQTVSMIKKYHDSRGDNVQIMVIPDIESVNWGRGVGYEMNEYFPPENLEAISATEIRRHIKDGEDDWKEFVDEVLQKDVETYLSNVIFPE